MPTRRFSAAASTTLQNDDARLQLQAATATALSTPAAPITLGGILEARAHQEPRGLLSFGKKPEKA
jgi:hypothetical protein